MAAPRRQAFWPRDQRRLGLAPAGASRERGRADAAAGALGQEALHAPVLERVKRDAAEPAALTQRLPGERQRAIELPELVVHRDPQGLEGALARMASGEARGGGDRRADRVHQLQRGRDRGALAAADDRPRDRARVALLAELPQDPRQPALVPVGDDLARAQLLPGIHAHVQGRVVGVGEPALASVHLHRGHAQVEVGDVGAQALGNEQLERLGVAAAQEANRAGQLAGERVKALFCQRIAVDRHERAGSPQALGQQSGMAAIAEGAVDRDLAGPWIEQLEQLVREHGHMAGRATPGLAAGLRGRRVPRSHPRGASLGACHLTQHRRPAR